MTASWVVVADASTARIYRRAGPKKPLSLVEGLGHPESRMKVSELKEDRPGRSFDSRGGGRHSMAEPRDVKGTEARKFARELARRMGVYGRRKNFGVLTIVAEPRFLGELRKQLSQEVDTAVTSSIGRDLTHLPDKELKRELALLSGE